MTEQELTIRSMTYTEFDEYQDYAEGLADVGTKENKITRLAATWVMDKIYGVDVNKTTMNPGKIMNIVTKTLEETFRVEDKEEKN